MRQGEIERRVKQCADTLESVFLRLKEKTRLRSEINVYADPEGWDAITGLVDEAYGLSKELFDTHLKKALAERGLGFRAPSYSYFTEKSKAPGVWFGVSKLAA